MPPEKYTINPSKTFISDNSLMLSSSPLEVVDFFGTFYGHTFLNVTPTNSAVRVNVEERKC